jgi:plastocyanin
MKHSTFTGIIAFIFVFAISPTKLSAQPPRTVTLSPATTQNIGVGGTINFTATRNSNNANWAGGNSNFTYTWSSSPAGVTFTNNPNTVSGNNSSTVATFPTSGVYQISCFVQEGGGGGNATSPATTVNVISAPAAPNLWATSSDGNQVSSFSVSNGVYFAGPTNIFDPFPSSTETTAALGRNTQPSAALGHYYWLPNDGANGVVNVYAATSTGASRTLIGSLDVNGSGTNSLGFVRLGMGPDGTGWILAGDGTTIYLAKFMSNGVSPVTISIEDANVSLVGGAASTFQNGDICVSGNGNLYALANDGGGVTQIFIGAANGSSTTLTKKWDLEDANSDPFNGRVNGVAFDLLGSLYLSTDDGLYYINQNTVNGPAGTVSCILVRAQTGLQDLASNVFPTQSLLPAKLLSFTASYSNQNATLNWDVEGLQNFSHFEVERSTSAIDFNFIAQKQPAGNPDNRATYQHVDNLSGETGDVFYYRLKMVDKDGRFSYSNVILVRRESKIITGIRLSPNPVIAGTTATVRFKSAAKSNVQFKVVDMNGRIVLSQNNIIYEGTNSVIINNLNILQPGTYVLQMTNGETTEMTKFSVAR